MRILRNILSVSLSATALAILVIGTLASWPQTAANAGDAATPVIINVVPFLNGLIKPVNLIPGGLPGDKRLFIVEQAGKILVVNPDGTIRSTPFLDISAKVDKTNVASGLFGLAFHPNYANNGYFYVYYIHREGDTRYHRLSRFTVSSDPDVANPASENVLLAIARTLDQFDHNAGDIHFGPDGYLYFPQGDGYFNVLTDRPQNPMSLFGKMLRINVDKGAGEGAADCKGQGSGDYTIPLSNPYIGSDEACDEIWASGLRNPWRFSFDKLEGDLYLSDVGQDDWDEINFGPAGTSGGMNYGWTCYEGHAAIETEQWPSRGCSAETSYTFPVLVQEIGSPQGDCSITGGYVYRGNSYPALVGRYIMSDYCSGLIRSATHDGGSTWSIVLHNAVVPDGAVSLGQDNDGELYALNRETGIIYRLTGEEATPTPTLIGTPAVTPSHTPAPGATATVPTETPTPSPTATVPTETPTPSPTVLVPTETPTPSATSTSTEHLLYLPAVTGDGMSE